MHACMHVLCVRTSFKGMGAPNVWRSAAAVVDEEGAATPKGWRAVRV